MLRPCAIWTGADDASPNGVPGVCLRTPFGRPVVPDEESISRPDPSRPQRRGEPGRAILELGEGGGRAGRAQDDRGAVRSPGGVPTGCHRLGSHRRQRSGLVISSLYTSGSGILYTGARMIEAEDLILISVDDHVIEPPDL